MATDVPAVTNAVWVLERIAREWPDAVSSGLLIEELGLNRSTCFNILATLRRAGWISSRGDRTGWMLGSRLLALTGSSGDPVAAVVQQELDELSHRLGLTAFAVTRHGRTEYAVMAKAEHGHGVRITVSVGDTFPLSAPAIMRAFHAWSDPAEVARDLDRNGARGHAAETRTGGPALHTALKETRARGYTVSAGEYAPGQTGVSAPVFDARGRVHMVVCALAFSSELGAPTVTRAGELVRDCGLSITGRTGGTAPHDGDRADRQAATGPWHPETANASSF